MNYLYALLITIIWTQFAIPTNANIDIYYGYRGGGNVPSLCEDPEVFAADRLVNNTVRLYRGDHYWELKGIPGTKGFLDGPHAIWYENLGTVHRNTSLVTFLSGYRKGFLTKFEGRKWWAWQPDGRQGYGDHGHLTDAIPKGGFTAVFHNGNITNPMLIGFETIKVYYYTTITDIHHGMRFVGSSDGYIGGQFGENFPPDITAAFSYPSTESSDGYFVYLFRKDKYCFRAAYRTDSTQPCDEWRLNTELFGCDGSSQPVITDGPNNPPPVSGGSGVTREVITDNNAITDKAYEFDTEAANQNSFGIAVRISITYLCVSFIIIWHNIH